LLKSTDILVESNPPSKMEELGISYRYLKDVNPRLIMTSITAFGQTGPYKDYKSCDLVSCHMGGPAYVTPRGAEDTSQEPLKWGGHFGSFQAGLGSVVATLGALYHQKATGLGQHVDISELESVIQNMLMPLYYYAYGAQICARTDVLDLAPFNILPCKDGYIYLAPLEEKEWRRMLEVMGNPDWGDDELFKDGRSRAQYWDGLRPLILEWTMQRTMEEIFHSGQTKRVPVGALFTAKEIMNFKQFTAREFFVDMEHKEAGKLRYPGVPYKFSEVKRESPTAAPLLGQHNEEVYCQRLGYTKSDLIKLKGSGII
jgi:CoA:oxalate CoA-transferase